jgi:DNA polymerase
MRTITIAPEYDAWRQAARALLRTRTAPETLLWSDTPEEGSLFDHPVKDSSEEFIGKIHVPRAFLEIANKAASHTDPKRWAVLYQVLWRLTLGGEPGLLAFCTDPDVRQLQEWCKAVGRDVHKMHAFVRFRRVGYNSETTREQFVAWFEPEHRIVRLAAPFFQKRFAGMDWSILTPELCAHWDGQHLRFTPGVPKSSAPDADQLDALWRTYYGAIFNPARVKLDAMQSEMPKKYWKNLPEAPLIAGLVAESTQRVQRMFNTDARPVKPLTPNPYVRRLRQQNGLSSPDATPDESSA